MRCGPLGSIVVKILDRVPLVTGSANGKPVTLVLDTGAEQTVLAGAANASGPKRPSSNFHGKCVVSLIRRQLAVELRSFAINGVAVPPPLRVRAIPPITALPADGLFGRDNLGQFDIDFEMPQGRAVLYQQGACDTPPNWPRSYETLEVIGLPGARSCNSRCSSTAQNRRSDRYGHARHHTRGQNCGGTRGNGQRAGKGSSGYCPGRRCRANQLPHSSILAIEDRRSAYFRPRHRRIECELQGCGYAAGNGSFEHSSVLDLSYGTPHLSSLNEPRQSSA